MVQIKMLSNLFNFLFRRNTLSYQLYRIERIIAEKKYSEAQIEAFVALGKFPNNPELKKLKVEAESFFRTYL